MLSNTDENFSPDLIRPPGSVEEGEFLKKCIKCDQCINACPTNVLQPATYEEGGLESLWTPVMNFRRTATRDTELAGAKIKAGDKVVVSFLSANHDEQLYPLAAQFDIRRDPNPHLSFGYGPHFCLGAQLAVSQMRAIFLELTQRFDSIQALAPPRFLRSNFQRGVKSLPIRWQARS